jgi:hypothetical protein
MRRIKELFSAVVGEFAAGLIFHSHRHSGHIAKDKLTRVILPETMVLKSIVLIRRANRGYF